MQRKDHDLPTGKKMTTDHVDVTMQVELRELVAKAADADEKAMTTWVRELLAKHFKRPELAAMPHARAGRPRKDSNGHGKNGHKS